MAPPKIYSEEIEEAGRRFSVTLFEVENAVLAFFSDEVAVRLGTLAVALPSAGGRGMPVISSILLGERNVTVTRILAERLAASSNKIALASTFIKTVDEVEAGRVLMRLTQRILEKRRSK